MNETSGVLRPAVMAYLEGRPMTVEQIAAMRAYLRQWISDPVWKGAADLREDIDQLDNRAKIRSWLRRAEEIGIDPL
jgi:hypothetical protein